MLIDQIRLPFQPPAGIENETIYCRDGVTLQYGDALDYYDSWEAPTVIISDGAYGLGLFPSDPHDTSGLAAWYEPHVAKWSQKALPQTTLWFWNSELGWATVHPLLLQHGWIFVNCHVWDKGIAHVAGNSNTQTLRKLPVVTEVCVQYVKEVQISGLSIKDWLRAEWERTGIPLNKTNEAAGVANAATRKYFTKDHLWYFPPPEAFEKIAAYANQHGREDGRPYFSLDGRSPTTAAEWEKMRAKFYCPLGVTNVWRSPQLNGRERLRNGSKAAHRNQKPLHQIELIIQASSDEKDVVWDPFGGIGTVPLASWILNRACFSAEIQRGFFDIAVERIRNAKLTPPTTFPAPTDASGAANAVRNVGTLWIVDESD